MSHCHDEHAAHGGHGHGHHDHEHDHSDDLTPAFHLSLYQHIRFDDIVTLNETETHSGKAIVKKTWAERMQLEPELVSNADDQIIMNVPFTGQVKLHCILLRSSLSVSAPRTLRMFVNRDDIDFDNVEDLQPTQEFELSRTSEVQLVTVKRALFGKVHRLTLFFVDNFGTNTSEDTTLGGETVESDEDDEDDDNDDDEASRLSYVGFRGEWMQLGRAPAQILYEAAPNPNDHAVKGTNVTAMGEGIGR